MFDIINNTLFTVASAVLFDPEGFELAVAAVKATFELPKKGGAAVLAPEQMAVLAQDEYEGDPEYSGIRYPADLIPGKRGTDIGLAGTVYNPAIKPVKKLKASVRVDDCYKEVLALGNRFWTKSLLRPGYTITDPEPFNQMPISTKRLFGGISKNKQGGAVRFAENPLGTGFVLAGNPIGGIRLPNFEDPKIRIKTHRKIYPPASFGFSLPCASHRLPFAGTQDEAWMNHRRPLYPQDLDLRFFNCAQPELISGGFLKGGETVALTHLTPDGFREFQIPHYDIGMTFKIKGQLIEKKAQLHTVMIEPDLNRFYMTWWASELTGKSPRYVDWIEVDIMK